MALPTWDRMTLRIKARALVDIGQTTREVSSALDIPISTLNYWRSKYDWPVSPIAPVPYDPEVRIQALAKIDSGASQSSVRREMGIARPTLARWLRRRGTSLKSESGNTPAMWRCSCGARVHGSTCLGCGSVATWATPVTA